MSKTNKNFTLDLPMSFIWKNRTGNVCLLHLLFVSKQFCCRTPVCQNTVPSSHQWHMQMRQKSALLHLSTLFYRLAFRHEFPTGGSFRPLAWRNDHVTPKMSLGRIGAQLIILYGRKGFLRHGEDRLKGRGSIALPPLRSRKLSAHIDGAKGDQFLSPWTFRLIKNMNMGEGDKNIAEMVFLKLSLETQK